MPSFASFMGESLISKLTVNRLDHWFCTDEQLHLLYPGCIRELAAQHWTPLKVARLVANFLVPNAGAKVLDIGSGVGKFCLAGAFFKPDAFFYGVEQRQHLVAHAEVARKILGMKNVHFFHENLIRLDFKQFDHFYFFNSFYENLLDTGRIDDKVVCSPHLYSFYNRALYRKLLEMPVGTRVATFHCLEGKIPPGYALVDEQMGTLLRFWLKIM